MLRGARGTEHQRLKEGVGEACPGWGHQRLKEGACEACLASECAPWTEKGREWKGNGVEEARKKKKKIPSADGNRSRLVISCGVSTPRDVGSK